MAGLEIVEGLYQSPILVQWQHAPRQARVLECLADGDRVTRRC